MSNGDKVRVVSADDDGDIGRVCTVTDVRETRSGETCIVTDLTGGQQEFFAEELELA